MFHKENFITKLVFYIHLWLEMNTELEKMFANNVFIIADIRKRFYFIMLNVLWSGRQDGLHEYGISDTETYKAFTDILLIGLSQLNEKIVGVYKNNEVTSDLSRLIIINIMINETVKEIAVDIEELFKPVTPCNK